MSEVCTLPLLVRRDGGRRLTRGHRIAPHRIVESWRREDEGQRDRLSASVRRADPSVCWNEDETARMQLAFLIAEPHLSGSTLYQEDFILEQVPMLRQRRSRLDHFGSSHKMLGAVVLRTHLEDELRGGGDAAVGVNAASPHLTFISLQ